MLKRLMFLLKVILLSLFSLVAHAQQAPEEASAESSEDTLNHIKFTTNDGFMLAGSYFPGLSNASGVLLLHDCNRSSVTFDNLMVLLQQHGLHALAVDLRGFGRSINEEFSHLKVKRLSKDIVSYQSELVRIKSYWESDILAAYNYLRDKIQKDRDVAVVSTGCTGSQAIALAEKMRINSFVMVTPKLNFMEKEHFKNLIDIPVYFIDSLHNADTYQTTKELFEWNGDSRSVLQIFKGDRHGHSLINGKNYIAADIALWLDDTLSK